MKTEITKKIENLKYWQKEIKPVSTLFVACVLTGFYLLCVTPMTYNEAVFYTLMVIGLIIGYCFGVKFSSEINEEIKSLEKELQNNVK